MIIAPSAYGLCRAHPRRTETRGSNSIRGMTEKTRNSRSTLRDQPYFRVLLVSADNEKTLLRVFLVSADVSALSPFLRVVRRCHREASKKRFRDLPRIAAQSIDFMVHPLHVDRRNPTRQSFERVLHFRMSL